ncbi:P-loop containing nucleoside triphosphate hydrolase protein [Boletus edulis BED1]|uniref:P-loop containing nucleoside triphosphate hydrolase protein n=1 Tax=Boletus edulis BED1 TaxID=1328754 RepID=A0AAD4GJ32_BOLED|nr:P-loop containing nucleoside triphosphate hydrolase protein [Boletus edulis BED1]
MNVPPGKASRGRFRYRRYGVYDLTYEDAASSSFTSRIYPLLDDLWAICKEIPYVRRQLVDSIKLAPAELMAYMVTTIWDGIYPAINLYWLAVLFDRLESGFRHGALSPDAYWSLALSWIFCAMVDVAAGRTRERSLEVLISRFRVHFIPQLIRDLFTVFPVEGRFESEFPGGAFLTQLGHLMQFTLGLISQVFVLLHAISLKQSPEREVLLCFCVARGFVRWLVPLNGIGCSAYIYWSNNCHFLKMKALFGLAFLTGYRADLVLDGIASSIETEYNKSAEQLGDVEVLGPTPWRTGLLREWYWDLLMEITLEHPVVIYALILSTHLSPSSIASMALLQQATRSISLNIGQYTSPDTPSLLGVCSQARRLYDAVNYQSTMPQGTEPFPRPIDKQVSLQYPGSDHHALCDVSFDILPGELVLVVGTNGSGKSSMLKLLARLFDPIAGEILIDDLPLLRAAMAFQSQSAVVYPVSVRENIALGLPPAFSIEQASSSETSFAHVEAAARAGGCSAWISRLSGGYDTQLQPSFDIHHGWLDGMYGYPSDALKEELARHKGHPVSISGAARTFMRINHCTPRLVVVDEATSRIDPVAERNILSAFRNARAGKTIVVVTHRFHQLAHEADRILCMKDGSVVENGTHAELVHANGPYAALYHAQVE